MQPRVAAAENMRYDDKLKNPGIKAEKTINHPGEVLLPPLILYPKPWLSLHSAGGGQAR